MDKLEVLKLVADLAERESDRYWRRTGTMLTVNAGLFVLVSVGVQNGLQWMAVERAPPVSSAEGSKMTGEKYSSSQPDELDLDSAACECQLTQLGFTSLCTGTDASVPGLIAQ